MAKLSRDGVEIFYETHGEGPAILLTHGYSATCDMWRGQIAVLSQDAQACAVGHAWPRSQRLSDGPVRI